MEEKESNQEGSQSESDDSQPQQIKQEYDIHREVEIEESEIEGQQLDNIRTQLDLERRRLEEERRQLELEKEKFEDSRPAIPGSQAGSSDSLCVVCGEKATGMHYMAVTCEGCKIFFRRTTKKHDTMRCTNLDNQGQCDMVNKRRFCSACRFQKCLDVGMNMGRIWNTDRLKTRKPSTKRLDPSPEPKAKTMKTKGHSSEQELEEGSLSTAPAPGNDGDFNVVSSSLGAPVTGAGADRTNAGARSRSLGAPVTDAGADRTNAGARSRTNAASSDGADVETSSSTRAGDDAGAAASPGAANHPWPEIKEEFADGHKQMIRSISNAYQNAERLTPFDSSKGSFTDVRKAHQMKKIGSAQGMPASQHSARQPDHPIATDSSTASSSMPNPLSTLWSGMDTGTQSSDKGRASQIDLPTSDMMASGESAAASVLMATKAAKKENAPIDLSAPESVGASASGGGMPFEFDFDSDMSKLCMELILHDLKQMIVFVKALPVYPKLPMIEQATFVKETFPNFWACICSTTYNPETNSFINHLTDPPEEFFVSDLCLGGAATFVHNYGMNYCIGYAKLKFTKEEHYLFCALCLLNPDRESFSDLIKQTVAPHYTRVVEVLCACGRINHADQLLWFPQMMSHMAETRKCSDMFKDMLMQLQLQGQSIFPLLGEVMDI